MDKSSEYMIIFAAEDNGCRDIAGPFSSHKSALGYLKYFLEKNNRCSWAQIINRDDLPKKIN